MKITEFLSLALGASLLAGCVDTGLVSKSGFLPGELMPEMRWDTRPEADLWTSQAMVAVARHDGELAGRVPGDIALFCPEYARATLNDRRAFWVGLMSATAKHESSFNPRASGGGGRYIGLMQIAPATARIAGCDARSSAALKDGGENLECAVRIMAPHVAADGMVAGSGNRGIARDWGPFSSASKRREIAAWTSQQDYCKA
jgi:hypothetical protein